MCIYIILTLYFTLSWSRLPLIANNSKDALIPQLYFRLSKPGTGHFDSETLDVNEIRETDSPPPFIEAIRRKLRDKRTISNKQKV